MLDNDNILHTEEKMSSEQSKNSEEAEQMEQSKQQIEDVKNEIKVNADIGVAVSSKEGQEHPYSALRITAQGKVFKGTAGETNAYFLTYLDGNPLKSTPYGKLALTKKMVNLGKGRTFNLEGEYTFTGKSGNIMKYGLSYGGQLKNGGYKLTLLPLNHNDQPLGTAFDVKFSGNVKTSQNGTFSVSGMFNGLDKADPSFYTELNYSHQIASGLSVFGELRTGGTFKEPYVAPMVGVRMNIK